MSLRLLFTSLAFSCLAALAAQTDVSALVAKYKEDPRGPYRDIRWFCASGDVREPKDPCPEPSKENRQHARYKTEVINLGRDEHLFLGQILAPTDRAKFWDEANNHSRLIQYQLGNYLAAIDDGWILRQAQYYRGAFQVEDEMAWGRKFFAWLLAKDEEVAANFYLIRQAVKDIPHNNDTNLTQKIRADSKYIADTYPKFMALRTKIHGQPEGKDAAAVESFLREHQDELATLQLVEATQTLADDIRTAYLSHDLVADLLPHIEQLGGESALKPKLTAFTEYHATNPSVPNTMGRVTAAADLLWEIRLGLLDERDQDRLPLLDASLILETIIFTSANDWKANDARALTEKICYLAEAAAGAGLVEQWEFEAAALQLADMNYRYVFPYMLENYLDNARRVVEWGTATNRAVYGEVVERYTAFEPKAQGFLDDRIRSSVLLPLGNAVGKLGDWVAIAGNLNNAMLDVPNQGQLRGLNPGYAKGTLHVIEGTPEELEVNATDIYVFATPPADLKPVGGIATVNEGNMVSHVQLLARNLGIPNAVLTDEQFRALRKYDGQEVFYAVSNGGTIVMKKAADLTDTEKALFTQTERKTDRITVPVENIRLDVRRVLNMREVRSKDSGKLCGPKAANLGQLKALFPEKVVEGLVIPFGIFRAHLDQPMPGQGGKSYWAFLNERFAEARKMEESGRSATEVEAYTLAQLDILREAILEIQLDPGLIQALQDSFRTVLGDALGKVPVFLRSDTNMEDLPDFTGAGLNLTVFNAVDPAAIIDGIKKVWASPYTERSYRWRQRYLLNPENVYPSILIIPSVDVDYSGVMITKGVASGREDDVTVAFSRGAGGAVDGQAAEAYLLDYTGRTVLLSPARERFHRRLPATGGSVMLSAPFHQRILSEANLLELRKLAAEVERVMPEAPGVTGSGPWDVELGFQNNRIWLFQIRPFVENKQAQSSDYLESISPRQPEGIYYDLTVPLEI
ncbi:PEP/pyruvate-binding domain-containing protein [Neolewinella lacunae]|uniref:Phosphoenolpyruvate synthase n=1 Tax=Neolewinella lacunae TaxID=1517758 RepID=A0A923PI48_9BACT|nr:PEP/pyruvate-binding domain-containing protein [Neolewinella lacunae]MBC6993126.1 phosphoenolpyruvate synthase [Neolewinella lacunae]MDN3633140.1 PEP/pyruvate-binding domain-containing protein [Neolewinella lacunae]